MTYRLNGMLAYRWQQSITLRYGYDKAEKKNIVKVNVKHTFN